MIATRHVRITAALLATALAGSACTMSRPDSASTSTEARTTTATHIRTTTQPAPLPVTRFTPAPATTVAVLSPGAAPPHKSTDGRCPYIASTPDENARNNVQDIIGSHVYRTTLLRTTRPVGCRFYFYAPPYEALADIEPRRFRSARDAYNAMVLTGRRGHDASGRPELVHGLDAVLYRTRFYGADGVRDWACVFAARRLMVVVHTFRDDTSRPALYLARAVAARLARGR